jgi:hypothetical protein
VQGGNNTKYFHLIANGKHRKKKIFQLEQDEGAVDEANLKVFMTEYYKKLFGASIPYCFSIVEVYNDDIPKLSPVEVNILIVDLMEKVVLKAISQMEHNKAPVLDGFSVDFYHKF